MILGIYGKSKSGKTTLAARLIQSLKEKGYSVGSVKNIHVEDFTIDTQGKDTWEHTNAGAEIVVASSGSEAAFLVNRGMGSDEVFRIIDKIADPDIVIVEGYWDDDSPKIAVGDIDERPNTVIRYGNNFDSVLEYAVEGIENERVATQLPGLDCGKCGMEKCIELALAIRRNERELGECYYFSERMVSLLVDGKDVPLGKFAKEIIAGTIAGMVSTLKGVEGGREISLEIRA